jgi:hypothetical protein
MKHLRQEGQLCEEAVLLAALCGAQILRSDTEWSVLDFIASGSNPENLCRKCLQEEFRRRRREIAGHEKWLSGMSAAFGVPADFGEEKE